MVKKTLKKSVSKENSQSFKPKDNMHITESRDIAYDFAVKVYKNFKEVIKSIVLFGSVPKKEMTLESDIDILIIVDDATIKWDDELIGWYREELSRLAAKEKYIKKIHINTVTLTAFWNEIREGEPITINVLRYGEALIDFGGFFEPLKALLASGRIKPSPESIFVTMERANNHVLRANALMLNAVETLYWAMVDSSHSALMAKYVIPPSPEFIPELLTETFVKTKMVDKKYVQWFMDMHKISKGITYSEITRMSGEKFEELQKKTEEYVRVFTDLTQFLIRNEKIIRVFEKQQ